MVLHRPVERPPDLSSTDTRVGLPDGPTGSLAHSTAPTLPYPPRFLSSLPPSVVPAPGHSSLQPPVRASTDRITSVPLSDSRSVQVGRSHFSRCCYLKRCVYTLIVFLPEPAGRQGSIATSRQSATSVFTMEQTPIFAASSILLRCSRATSTAEKSGPSI